MSAENEEPKYYSVEIDGKGHKKITGLPPGENPKDYVIFLATGEIVEKVGTKYAAVKDSKAISEDADAWDDQGGPVKN